MSTLANSLEIWCTDIHRVNTTLNIKYDQNSIYGFKNGQETAESYNVLKTELDNLELTKENMNSFIFQLFCRVSPQRLGKFSFYFLTKMVYSKKLINIDASEDHISTLTNILDKALTGVKQKTEAKSKVKLPEKVDKKEIDVTKLPDSLGYGDIHEVDLKDCEKFFKIIKKELSKHFAGITSVLGSHFDARLAMFIKDTQTFFGINTNLINLVENSDRLNLDNLSRMNTQSLIEMIQTRVKKILICQNEINLLNQHAKQGTIPKSFSHSNFPVPFLIDDRKFIAEYDRMISEWQIGLCSFVLNYLENDCKQVLEKEIDELQQAIKSRSSYDEISHQVLDMYDSETKLLKSEFDKAFTLATKTKKNAYIDIFKNDLKIKNRITIMIRNPEIEKEEKTDLEAESSLIGSSSFSKLAKSKQSSKGKKTRLNRSQTFAKSRSQTSKPKPVQAKPVELYHVETKPIANQRSSEQQAYTKYSSKSAFNFKEDLPKAGHSSPMIKSERVPVREKSNLKEFGSINKTPVPANNPNLIVNGLTSNGGIKKLMNPLSSRKKYLPELRTRLSLEDLKSMERVGNEKAEEINVCLEPIQEGTRKQSHSSEFKEIVSKVLMLKNFSKNRPKTSNASTLLFNNSQEKDPDIMKVVIKQKTTTNFNKSPCNNSNNMKLNSISSRSFPRSNFCSPNVTFVDERSFNEESQFSELDENSKCSFANDSQAKMVRVCIR